LTILHPSFYILE